MEHDRRRFLQYCLGGAASLAGGIAGPGFGQNAVEQVTGATPSPLIRTMPPIDGLPVQTLDAARARQRCNAPVAVTESGDPAEASYEVLRLLKPPLRADRVFFKVNCSFHTSQHWQKYTIHDRPTLYATGSDPRFVEGALQYLREQGIRYESVTIGEAVGGRMELDDYFELLGWTELAGKTGVKLLNINRDAAAGMRIPQSTVLPHFAVSRTVAEHYRDGVFINCAKMKTHRLPGVTLGTKNMMGTILPPTAKRLCHAEFEASAVPGSRSDFYREGFYESLIWFGARLADLAMMTPDLVLIDGVIAGEGSGFLEPDTKESTPIDGRRAFASESMINADTAASWYMGFDPRNPQLEPFPEMDRFWWLYFGALKGFGHDDINRIRILGDRRLIDSPRKFRFFSPFKLV